MPRIADAFARIRESKQPGLVAYVTAGDPDLSRTAEILVSLAQSGADVLEVGVPFSDPLADGPVIQRASERALAFGSEQLLLQHRALFDLLEARAEARQD